MNDILASHMPRPRVGLLLTGHEYYWDQFPRLQQMGLQMANALKGILGQFGEIIASELVDTVEKSQRAGRLFCEAGIDLLMIFPLGYTTSMMIVPAVGMVNVPVRFLNAHEDRSYDYASADTTMYLHHEGVCCIPEYACASSAPLRPT